MGKSTVFFNLIYNYNKRNLKERSVYMTVEQRIRMCLLIEKIQKQKEYSEKLGLEDISRFHGEKVDKEERTLCYL